MHARTPAARQPSRYPFIGVPALEYEGERSKKAYCLNMTYHKDRQNRAELSLICGSVKYLIPSVCPDRSDRYQYRNRPICSTPCLWSGKHCAAALKISCSRKSKIPAAAALRRKKTLLTKQAHTTVMGTTYEKPAQDTVTEVLPTPLTVTTPRASTRTTFSSADSYVIL